MFSNIDNIVLVRTEKQNSVGETNDFKQTTKTKQSDINTHHCASNTPTHTHALLKTNPATKSKTTQDYG